MTPGVNTYDARISACDKEDKVEKAMEMLAELQQSACEKNHYGEKAGLHGEMQQVDLIPLENYEAEEAMEQRALSLIHI